MLVELSPGTRPVDRPAPLLGNRQLWLIAALAVIPHLGGLTAGFVYDDFRFLAENPGVQALSRPHELWLPERMSVPPDHDIWRPLRTIGLALQYQCFGGTAAGYHAVSLVGFLLVLRAFLAWLQTLPGMSRTAVVFSGLLFGLHPLSVESVAWISSQGDLGAAGCVFLSLRASRRRPAVALIWGCLAFLFKESALPLVAVVGLWLSPAGRRRERASRVPWSFALLAVATIAYVMLRQHVLGRDLGLGSGGLGQEDAGLSDRLWTACQNLHLALRLFVWPLALSVDYGGGWLPLPTWRDALFAAVAVLPLGWACRGSGDRVFVRRLALLAALLFFLPTAGLLAPVKGQMAERFLLLPVACLSLAAGTFLGARPSRLLQGGLVLVLLLLAVRTALRTHDWRSQEALFQAECDLHPESVQAHLALAAVALERGQFESAREHYAQVLERTAAPDVKRLGALYGLGALAYEQGQREEAWQWMLRCREELAVHPPASLDPVLARTYVVLGNLARSQQGPEAAEAMAREGVARFGRQPDLLETLAIARDMQGDAAGAIPLYEEALSQVSVPTATLCYHLALALVHQGQTDRARARLRQALEIDPGHARSRALLDQLEP